MPDYDDMRVARSEKFRGQVIKAYQAKAGAAHCKIEHEVEAERCVLCGAPLERRTVFLMCVNGQIIFGPEFEDADKALESAKQLVEFFEAQAAEAAGDEAAGDEAEGQKKEKEEEPVDPELAALVEKIEGRGWNALAYALVHGEDDGTGKDEPS